MTMTKTIWKYELEITDVQTIKIPDESIILKVDNQRGRLCLWVLVEPDTEPVDRMFRIYGTGHVVLDRASERDYVGSVIIEPFVWHVFEDHKY